MIQDTQTAQISQKQDERNIYVIMKTMCPPGYHHNGFVTTHALGHMMYIMCMYHRISCAQVHELPQSHCGDNREGTLRAHIYIHIYTHTYIYIIFVNLVEV